MTKEETGKNVLPQEKSTAVSKRFRVEERWLEESGDVEGCDIGPPVSGEYGDWVWMEKDWLACRGVPHP